MSGVRAIFAGLRTEGQAINDFPHACQFDNFMLSALAMGVMQHGLYLDVRKRRSNGAAKPVSLGPRKQH